MAGLWRHSATDTVQVLEHAPSELSPSATLSDIQEQWYVFCWRCKNVYRKYNNIVFGLRYCNFSYPNNNSLCFSYSTVMRMTMSTGPTMSSRVHRKVIRIPSKRYPGKMLPGKLNSMSRVSVKLYIYRTYQYQYINTCIIRVFLKLKFSNKPFL